MPIMWFFIQSSFPYTCCFHPLQIPTKELGGGRTRRAELPKSVIWRRSCHAKTSGKTSTHIRCDVEPLRLTAASSPVSQRVWVTRRVRHHIRATQKHQLFDYLTHQSFFLHALFSSFVNSPISTSAIPSFAWFVYGFRRIHTMFVKGFCEIFQKNFQHRSKPSFCISFMCSVPLSIV